MLTKAEKILGVCKVAYTILAIVFILLFYIGGSLEDSEYSRILIDIAMYGIVSLVVSGLTIMAFTLFCSCYRKVNREKSLYLHSDLLQNTEDPRLLPNQREQYIENAAARLGRTDSETRPLIA